MGKGCIKTRSTPALFAPVTVKWTTTLCHYPNAKFSCSMTKRRKGSTNKELLTWKWDRLPPWFLTWTEEWGNNANFSWATLRTNFPGTMAISYASAISWKEHAYLLKFYDQSMHVLEGREPFFSRMMTFEMILVFITSTLKSLAIRAIRLALSSVIYS